MTRVGPAMEWNINFTEVDHSVLTTLEGDKILSILISVLLVFCKRPVFDSLLSAGKSAQFESCILPDLFLPKTFLAKKKLYQVQIFVLFLQWMICGPLNISCV
jgi:hypothetical protein